MVLTRILREKLVEFNPNLPDAAYDDAARELSATLATQNIAATNRQK